MSALMDSSRMNTEKIKSYLQKYRIVEQYIENLCQKTRIILNFSLLQKEQTEYQQLWL